MTNHPTLTEARAAVPNAIQYARQANGTWDAYVAGDTLPTQPESAEAIIKRMESIVQEHLDATARAAGYDNIYTAVTYADEPADAEFQAEGRSFRAWRSLVWRRCVEILTEVQQGLRPIPTEAELIALLPAL